MEEQDWTVRRVIALPTTLALAAGLLLAALVAPPARADSGAPKPAPAAVRTIFDLQPSRTDASVAIQDASGRRGTATLVNLNPAINAWFVLTLEWGTPGGGASYHLENPHPKHQTVRLATSQPDGLAVSFGDSEDACIVWLAGGLSALEAARRSGQAYAPLCDGRLYLRNRVPGARTELERTTDLLRDRVPGGERLIGLVKEGFHDRFRDAGARGTGAAATPSPSDGPLPAVLAPSAEPPVVPSQLGIDVGQPVATLRPGRWYPASGLAGVYVSYVMPRALTPELLRSARDRVNELDAVEAGAVDYLIAFDLQVFELGFAIGTDHPRVGWSDRVAPALRDRAAGPDGIASIAPLVGNGQVSPALAGLTVATFTGGFKRQHGAFKYGALAERNHGSHYGFIEHGTVLSTLQPGLSTLYMLDDGTVEIATWSNQLDALLPRIRHARQNGVALIEYDPATGSATPGALVNRWGPGNWSGSADEQLRSVRAGACVQATPNRRFLIYGYFSAATPSAMARVFQAYGCRDAIHLDMNALEHTYLAIYVVREGETMIEHLVQGMAQIDKKVAGGSQARFLQVPDDRDFFYVVRREVAR